MNLMDLIKWAAVTAVLLGMNACAPKPPHVYRVPSKEYAAKVKWEHAKANPEYATKLAAQQGFRSNAPAAQGRAAVNQALDAKASLRLVADENLGDLKTSSLDIHENQQVVSNMGASADYQVFESTQPNTRDYNGPLSFGDPGLSSSLWKESMGGTQLFRDYRAFQPMDLITIVVTETSEGKSEADTEIKEKSTLKAAIESLLGLESTVKKTNPQVNMNNLIGASTKNDFKGEGETTRKGSLKGRISAMVAEVLPSGVLRIEGEKIITVNNEDQIMVISGLVRPEDVNSNNEVDSSKVANMRIDYTGKGVVSTAQHGGWLGNIIRAIWPF